MSVNKKFLVAAGSGNLCPNIKRVVLIFFAIVSLAGVSACAYSVQLYTGPELPSREIVKLYCAPEVRINAFDGKEFILTEKPPDYFEVLPGHHSVTVVYLGSGRGEYKYGVSTIILKFEAEPGQKYYIDSKVNWVDERKGTWQAWIEERTIWHSRLLRWIPGK